MDLLWTSDELITAMEGRLVGNMPDGVTGISIDSRDVPQGAAFFAIKGDRFDGHDFASAALANGAGVLIIAEDKIPAMGNLSAPMIVVGDVLTALEALGRAARRRVSGKVAAVTGSVGKTTTKEMLRTALSPSGKIHASVASFNNHWGVPLTLARMPRDTDFGVFEIGMNHSGEIRTLVDMVRPDVAMITCVEPAHMGNFKNLNEIADAKAEIMEGVVKDGSMILNLDNDLHDYLKTKANALGLKERTYSYGRNDKADFELLNLRTHKDCSCFTVKIKDEEIAVKLGAPGDHIIQNAIGVLGMCSLIGADMALAALALADFEAEKGRGERSLRQIGAGHFTLIDESYNANPASMRAGISLLAATEPGRGGRRIAVLGDMLEMGEFSEKLHVELAQPLQDARVDIVALSGKDMNYLADAIRGEMQVYYRSDLDALIEWLMSKVRSGDVIMVKSSLGIGFGKVVKKLQEKFPECEPDDDQLASGD
ncbi:MAG: UDP-N-acetylmuramoylalanyl-D-glutamyl-2,6-diaminopimelate--D-alanyl-D-alanine ligase [Lentilitoribacter sp.]